MSKSGYSRRGLFGTINEEREIPGRQKVVRGLNVPVLTSHAGLNPRSKSGYEPERRVINFNLVTSPALLTSYQKIRKKIYS